MSDKMKDWVEGFRIYCGKDGRKSPWRFCYFLPFKIWTTTVWNFSILPWTYKENCEAVVLINDDYIWKWFREFSSIPVYRTLKRVHFIFSRNIDQASLGITSQLRMTLNSRSPCFCFLGARITDVYQPPCHVNAVQRISRSFHISAGPALTLYSC